MPFKDGTGPGDFTGGRRQGRQGLGRRLGNFIGKAFGFGLGGNCICPNCGEKTPHLSATPCSREVCSKCNTRMVRE